MSSGTMARSMVGGDENATQDVGLFIAAIDELRGDGAALVVHHTGKNGDDERGSSALRAAADVSMKLHEDGAGLRLECKKAKDAEEFEPWRLHLSEVAESCVIRCGTDAGRMAPTERAILEAVSASFGTTPTSATRIKEAAGVTKSSFYRSLKSLTARGFLDEIPSGNRTLYQLTAEGQRELVPPVPTESHGTSPPVPSHPSLYGTVGLEDESGREAA